MRDVRLQNMRISTMYEHERRKFNMKLRWWHFFLLFRRNTSRLDRCDDDAMKWNGKSTITNSVGKKRISRQCTVAKKKSTKKYRDMAISEPERTKVWAQRGEMELKSDMRLCVGAGWWRQVNRTERKNYAMRPICIALCNALSALLCTWNLHFTVFENDVESCTEHYTRCVQPIWAFSLRCTWTST